MHRLALALASIGAVVAAPTFNKDVEPVLRKHCQSCHRPGEAGPMSFITYKETRPFSAAIRQAVSTGKMPPWHADSKHGQFINERKLSAAEIATITDWAQAGAPEGKSKDLQPPAQWASGWTIGKPDVVIDMGADYKVPASGTIDYTYFVVPTNFTEDKWVEKIEVRPGDGARPVVHHIVLLARPKGSSYMAKAKQGEAYVPLASNRPPERKPDVGVGVLEGAGIDGYMEMVAVYVPGGDAYVTKPGQARLIPANSDLVFQMHYTANGKETMDRSLVGMVFAKEPPKERVVNTFVSNRNLVIPPQEGNHKVVARAKVHEDVKLQAFFPHMHLRGKAMEYRLIYPTGESQLLLTVPKYDFNWQMTYELAKPVVVPKGTEIEVSAWYDNSPNNKYNPDPTQTVYWGDQSWEEMLAGFADFVIPVDMKPGRISPKRAAR